MFRKWWLGDAWKWRFAAVIWRLMRLMLIAVGCRLLCNFLCSQFSGSIQRGLECVPRVMHKQLAGICWLLENAKVLRWNVLLIHHRAFGSMHLRLRFAILTGNAAERNFFKFSLSLSVRLTLSIPRFWRCWRLDERGTVHSLERSRRNAVDCWWAQAFLMDSRKYFSYSNTKNKFMNAAMMVANGRHTRTAAHTVHRFTQRHWNRTFLHR